MRMLSYEAFHRSPMIRIKKNGELVMNDDELISQISIGFTLERYSISRTSLSVNPFCVGGLLFMISSCSSYNVIKQVIKACNKYDNQSTTRQGPMKQIRTDTLAF